MSVHCSRCHTKTDGRAIGFNAQRLCPDCFITVKREAIFRDPPPIAVVDKKKIDEENFLVPPAWRRAVTCERCGGLRHECPCPTKLDLLLREERERNTLLFAQDALEFDPSDAISAEEIVEATAKLNAANARRDAAEEGIEIKANGARARDWKNYGTPAPVVHVPETMVIVEAMFGIGMNLLVFAAGLIAGHLATIAILRFIPIGGAR